MAVVRTETERGMRMRNPAPWEWQSHRATILDLYIDQDLDLSQVMEAMATHGFHAT